MGVEKKKKDSVEGMQTKPTPDPPCLHTALELAFHHRDPERNSEGAGGNKLLW